MILPAPIKSSPVHSPALLGEAPQGINLEARAAFWQKPIVMDIGVERIMRRRTMLAFASVILSLTASPALAQKKPPYWASISAGEARMRTGPGRQFPASWLYQRAGLPVKVIETYPNWRKIEDPDGATGWMQTNLLTDDRAGLVVKGEIRALREAPNGSARIVWRVEPGVIGKLSECRKGWCKIDVHGKMGYIEAVALWGVDPDEREP
jgi:SH3-like domain-containing protein